MGACPLCHFEGARRFTLLAKGKTSAPQSAAYGGMTMATCCRKRQLFSCRLPSASERRNLWQNPARVLYSLFGNADCIPPSRGGAKTRSTSQRLCRRSAQGDTKKQNCIFYNFMRVRKPRLFVGAVGCFLALPQSGNARVRAPLLLFPKISLRCDFREPCLAHPICRKPAAE